eukprot:scaffold28558_cov101-Isochrysis_galbana.AAC.4
MVSMSADPGRALGRSAGELLLMRMVLLGRLALSVPRRSELLEQLAVLDGLAELGRAAVVGRLENPRCLQLWRRTAV